MRRICAIILNIKTIYIFDQEMENSAWSAFSMLITFRAFSKLQQLQSVWSCLSLLTEVCPDGMCNKPPRDLDKERIGIFALDSIVSDVAGTSCEIEIDECQSQPCLHGGSCHAHINGFWCTCLEGFQGEGCDINIDECSDQPCQNGAVCVDEING